MRREDVEQRARELFQGGLHCAEVALLSTLEGADPELAARLGEWAPKAATAFGGGVARSKKGLCGALSGGLIALGLLRGRNSAETGWDELALLAESVRARFVEEFGCTRCGVILEKLGPQEGMGKCVALTATTAGLFYEALTQENKPARAQPCCGCGAGGGTASAG